LANFNPSVPATKDPNYLSYSRPITQPESDKSAQYAGQAEAYQGKSSEYQGDVDLYRGKESQYQGGALEALFKGIGDVFKSGVTATDQYFKKSIDTDLYTAVDAQRNQYTQQLEETAAGGARGQPSGATGYAGAAPSADGPMNILNPSARSNPDGLDKGLQRIDTIVAARANDKMSETQYIGNLSSIAKGLRTQYPGYREYIDQKISESTGMNPANAYVKSLIKDIDASVSAQKGETEKTTAMLRKEIENGTPYAAQAYDIFQQTGNVSWANAWVSKMNSQKFFWKNEEDRRKYEQGGRDEEKADVFKKADLLGAQTADNHFEMITVPGGLDSAKTVSDFVIGQTNGSSPKLRQEDAQALGQRIMAQQATATNAIYQTYVQKGWITAMGGPEEAMKRAQAATSMFKTVGEYIYNEKYGPAFAAINQNKSMVADTLNQWYSNKDMGPFIRDMAALEQAGPTYGSKLLERFVTDVNIEPKMKEFVNNQVLGMASQTDYVKNGIAKTQKQALESIQSRMPDDPSNPGKKLPVPAAATEQVIRLVDDIASKDATDAQKINIARAAFDPKNRDLLEKFERDSASNFKPGPQLNGPVKGRSTLFERMTSQAITSEIARLDKTSPGVLKMYQNWAESEFAKHIFRDEINELKNIQSLPGTKVSWDNENMRIKLDVTAPGGKYNPFPSSSSSRGSGTPAAPSTSQFLAAQDNVERLNRGLETMKGVAKAAGGDVNAYVFKLLKFNGVDLAGNSVASDLGRGMITANTKEGSTSPAMRFSEEPKTPTLGEYLSNPVGGYRPPQNNAPVSSTSACQNGLYEGT
jgi:hypothetical protein